MLHRYFPHTSEDIAKMLNRCSMASVEELYADVPPQLLLGRDLDLPGQMSEKEVRDYFKRLASRNRQLVCFAGAGYYDHYTPAVIPSILSRSEYLTAYTPYQPEISQGTLQYIFEYQSMMTQLTGLEVSNASMYDGATATAEAMIMTVAASRKRNRVLVSATVLPNVREVMATYAHYHGVQLETIPEKDGVTDREMLSAMIAEGDIAGVIVAAPNANGIIEDYTGLADECHKLKTLLVMNCVASALGIIRTPGEWGADIACGDAQSLGMPLNYGGPYLGYLCSTKALMRKLPGRIVGATTDRDGKRVFVLTLQAREQHIRREKATSNICSNQGLMSLFVTVYLSLMGPEGLLEVNRVSCGNAHYLAERLTATGKARLKYPSRPYLNEFVLVTDAPADDIIAKGVEKGLLCGVRLSDHELLVAATEMQTRDEINLFADIVAQL